MLRRVRAQLEVHAGEPDQPERATLTLTRTLLSGFPRQRPTTLGLVGFAPHPGLTPTPWALDGVLEACVEAERTPVQLLRLADPETAEALLRKAGRTRLGGAEGSDLVERPSRDRLLSLRSHGQRRPFAVPRELVGTSLILIVPLLLRAHEQSSSRTWQGPLALALEQLARAWGWRGPETPRLGSGLTAGLRPLGSDDGREAATAGLELVAASFVSAAVIIDATWAGALEAEPSRARGLEARITKPIEPTGPRLLGELDSPDRCLAVADLHRLSLDAVLGVDAWLSKALGLDLGPASRTGLAPSLGERSPGRWPQLVVAPRSQPTRLADRAIAGIRTQSKRLAGNVAFGFGGGGARELPALPARVPGRFAQHWTARWYAEHERLGR